MNEFMRFVHMQRSIGNTSNTTTTTTLVRDEEVDESSMAIQSSMGVETVITAQEQTSQLETADAEIKSLKSELSSCKKLQIEKEEQGFMMEPTVQLLPLSQNKVIASPKDHWLLSKHELGLV
jgi:uncharacterized protein (DUF342 family)